jgi:phosphoglycerate dehydrogenase-like enzyme
VSGDAERPAVVVACSEATWDRFADPAAVARLEQVARVVHVRVEVASGWTEAPPPSPAEEAAVAGACPGAVALVISSGAPRVGDELLDALPAVRFVGELEGDRFASRVDVEACWRRGVRVVDTNNAMSYPVAEWALALMLAGLRNYGAILRSLIVERDTAGARERATGSPPPRELSGRTVGLLGFGHIARRLTELLAPFHCRVFAHDPYVPIELAEAYDVTLTSLDNLLSLSEVVVVLVPITPATSGLLGAREIDRLRPGTVFVNVARGAVVDHAALLGRLRRGDLVACLDVFDPEPIPADSPFLELPNVVLSPHIASATRASGPRSLELMAEELERHLAGHQTRYDLLARTLENRRGQPPGSSVPGPSASTSTGDRR